MPLMEWSERLSVRIPAIDNQHKRLIALINRLHDAVFEGYEVHMMVPLVQDLLDYARTHFRAEERIFEQYSYPEAEKHKAAHEEFVRQVREIRRGAAARERDVALKAMRFLKEWLAHHLMGTDRHYAAYVHARGYVERGETSAESPEASRGGGRGGGRPGRTRP